MVSDAFRRWSDSAVLLGFILLGATMAAAVVYAAPEEERGETKTSTHVYDFGEVRITLNQQNRDRGGGVEEGIWTDADIEIDVGGVQQNSMRFVDMDPSGIPCGVFVPKAQPSKKAFIMVKLGDYDGRLLMIDGKGAIRNIPGGRYFITKDGRFLVSDYVSDTSGFSVIDLEADRVVFCPTDLPDIYEWYSSDDGLFFTESKWDEKDRGAPSEVPDRVYSIDLDKFKIERRDVKPADISGAKTIKFDFDPVKGE